MPRFRYTAVSNGTDTIQGVMEADRRGTVVDRLHALGQIPIRIEDASASALPTLHLGRSRKGRLSPKTLSGLTAQLATLLTAGLALDDTLAVMCDTIRRPADREIIAKLLEAVSGGASMADAMAAQPNAFPAQYVSMVRAGEAGGQLHDALERLADYLERAQETREHVTSALAYPAVVTVTCLASLLILFAVVVPRFRPLFRQAGDALPPAAANLLAVSDFVNGWWWAMLLLPMAATLLFLRYLRQPAARLRWERRLFALPVLGDIVFKAESARICRALGSMLRNGVTLPQAIALAREAARSRMHAGALDMVGEAVRSGRGFAQPMHKTGAFPAIMTHMLRVGEETGRQDDMLLKSADILEAETKRTIDRGISLLAPAITIALGIVVAAVIIIILTAMLSVYDVTM